VSHLLTRSTPVHGVLQFDAHGDVKADYCPDWYIPTLARWGFNPKRWTNFTLTHVHGGVYVASFVNHVAGRGVIKDLTEPVVVMISREDASC
jgi:hypothetical protein